jgi:preprotein translocase subunit SecE
MIIYPAGPTPETVLFNRNQNRSGKYNMAKPSPAEFVRQVQAESRKIVWPTWNDTVRTAILVLIMTTLLGLFFLGVDSVFNGIVGWLLSLA